MGCCRYHSLCLLDDIYLYRSQKQLSSRKYPHSQLPCADCRLLLCSTHRRWGGTRSACGWLASLPSFGIISPVHQIFYFLILVSLILFAIALRIIFTNLMSAQKSTQHLHYLSNTVVIKDIEYSFIVNMHFKIIFLPPCLSSSAASEVSPRPAVCSLSTLSTSPRCSYPALFCPQCLRRVGKSRIVRENRRQGIQTTTLRCRSDPCDFLERGILDGWVLHVRGQLVPYFFAVLSYGSKSLDSC